MMLEASLCITLNKNMGFTHVNPYFSKEMGPALGYVNATTSKVEFSS